MSSIEAANVMKHAIHTVDDSIEVMCVPIGDGGEGTAATLVSALKGEMRSARCVDAIGRPHIGHYGFIPATKLAIVEIAEAVGIDQLSEQELDPWKASSLGVGMLIRHALDAGAREFIICLGGSATNDCGAGMLAELGAWFSDADGHEVAANPTGLSRICHVYLENLDARFVASKFLLASDVNNVLLGADGATAVFGPQKGVKLSEVGKLDSVLAHFCDLLEEQTQRRIRKTAGAGAAGGLGAAFLATSEAQIQRGIDVVLDTVSFNTKVADADWVFSGEGKIDGQTASGKAPFGVAQAAAAQGVKSVLFGGSVGRGSEQLLNNHVVAIVPTVHDSRPLEEALLEARKSLERAVEMATRLIVASSASSGTR